jgi:hypothetical protein
MESCNSEEFVKPLDVLVDAATLQYYTDEILR